MAYDQTDAAPSLATRLDAELRDAHPLTILRKAYETFGDKLALVSSFGAESAVLLHLASRVAPNIAVLFLDTGMLFGQTLDYRKQLAAQLGLTDVRDLRPAFADLAVTDPKSDLWRTDVDGCCHIRKVLPLDRALGGFDGWITGRKRFHGGDRLRLAVVEEAEGKIKFNPLANWSKAELDSYIAEYNLPAIRWSPRASRRSAAGPAPSRPKRAKTSAPAAGRAGQDRVRHPRRAGAGRGAERGRGYLRPRGTPSGPGPPPPKGEDLIA
jgi:phosphoadenosine phosphosulfate reductase